MKMVVFLQGEGRLKNVDDLSNPKSKEFKTLLEALSYQDLLNNKIAREFASKEENSNIKNPIYIAQKGIGKLHGGGLYIAIEKIRYDKTGKEDKYYTVTESKITNTQRDTAIDATYKLDRYGYEKTK